MVLRWRLRAAVRALLVAVCLVFVWLSYKIARAEVLAGHSTVASLREAIALIPDQPGYYIHLAQLVPDEADALLTRAMILAPFDAPTRIELALHMEAKGKLARAEDLLLRAASIDHTWLPRWSLANFYFRHGREADFWTWAHRAAEMPSADLGPLFQLCSRASTDPARIVRYVLPNHANTLAEFLWFLLSRDDFSSTPTVVDRLIRCGNRDYRGVVLAVIDRLLAHGDSSTAAALWSQMEAQNWIPVDRGEPYNGSFSRPFLQSGFDWHTTDMDGITRMQSAAGIEIEFSGSEAESCTLLEQPVWSSRTITAIQYRLKSSGIVAGSGLKWQLLNSDGEIVGASTDLVSDNETDRFWKLHKPIMPGLTRLRLCYKRALGTTRLSGALRLAYIRLLFG